MYKDGKPVTFMDIQKMVGVAADMVIALNSLNEQIKVFLRCN